MAKTVGPAFSLSAQGKLGKSISYFERMGQTLVGYYAGNKNKRPRLFSELQRYWQNNFKVSRQTYLELSPETKWYYDYFTTAEGRMGSCLFMSTWLSNNGPSWQWYPLPKQLDKIIATDDINQYDKILADLETLTGLSFRVKPAVLGSPLMGSGWEAFTVATGLFWVLGTKYFASDGYYYNVPIVAHELTHCLLIQHCYLSFGHIQEHEDIAYACGARVAAGELVPVYTYKGQTLSEFCPC